MIEVVGIADDGWDSLTQAAQQRITQTSVLIGGARHLALVPPVAGQVRHAWPSPLRSGLRPLLDDLRARHPEASVIAVASGDPLRSGVGSTLIELLGADEVTVTPALSSDTLARARMGWPAEHVDVVTIVGRSLDRVRRHLDPGSRLIVLCSDGTDPAALAALLIDEGCPRSTMTAWSHLGGADEQRLDATAQEWPSDPTPDLVLVCVQIDPAARRRHHLGSTPGRAEDVFGHDGQISKRDVRASALAHLRPHTGGVLWDLGAGSGAVALEWCLAADRATAVAVERDPARAAQISVNAAALGVPTEVHVVEGGILETLADEELPEPAAVFVGGGIDIEVLETAIARLASGGRLVAHAVTLESEAELVTAAGRYGGSLTRISVEHAEPLGRFLSWRPARAVVQWSVTTT